MSQYYTATDHFVLLPAIMLALFGCAVLLFDVPVPGRSDRAAQMAAHLRHSSAWALRRTRLLRQQTCLTTAAVDEIIGFQRLTHCRSASRIFFNWIFLLAALIVAHRLVSST